ncbi:MAG: methylmalonyl-CoA epimerase, partial [Rhizobiales bacterium]|nr:methylmalonyl-CoA epimerase [Hyphomicrobiales bacterium]
MIGRLNHVAIAVPDLQAAICIYREAYGARISEALDQPDQGVRMLFVELDNTKIELLEPLGESSPI